MLSKPADLLEHTTDLIHACIDGNRHSQNQLYRMFAAKMFAVCLRYCRSREEAEEIVQEGFIQVFKSLSDYKNAGSFEGWIKRIMANCAVQYFRSKPKMHPVVHIDTVITEDVGTEEIITWLGKKELLKMVQNLPPAYRMIFNLHVFEGLKHSEIAELLCISEGTSKSNLHDAKRILQRAVINSLKIAKNI